MNKFRPQEVNLRWKLTKNRKYRGSFNTNWQTRIKWYPAGWGFNKKVIGDQFSRLHYLAYHAPKPIQLKWRSAYNSFYNKHFAGKGKASVRFLNKYTCHAWL